MTTRLNAKAIAPEAYNALRGLQDYVDASGIEKPLLELVKVNPRPMRNTMNANPTLPTSSTSSFAMPGAARFAALAFAPVERAAYLLATWRQRAADRQHLLTLDDGMLRDIGLSRADVEFESSKPFWQG